MTNDTLELPDPDTFQSSPGSGHFFTQPGSPTQLASESQEEQIHALVRAMARDSTPPQFMEAGYTYLGQFIAHDIVEETHPRHGTKRRVGLGLNLDSLYGTDYTELLDARGLFPQTGHDLPRCAGRAQIPEPRNDENRILAQLHRFWQRVHNFTITSGCAANAAEARRLVTLLFQVIVVEDYLRQLLLPAVFHSYFRLGERWLSLDATSVPKLFSHAAFRFGHSMVRGSYSVSALNRDLPLSAFFGPGQPIDAALQIDWRLFFGWNDGHTQPALGVDPYVTPEMQAIGGGTVPINIIEMNLRSGLAAGLPTGKQCVEQVLMGARGKAIKEEFGLAPLRNLIPLEVMPGGLTDADGITVDNLPLWPYLLTEARVLGERKYLGPLGSLICAEVLANSLARAQHTILSEQGSVAFDKALEQLGALGRRLEAVRAVHAHRVMHARALTMRHIVELIG